MSVKHITVRRKLRVSADSAFKWLTDYTPDDSAIFGEKEGGRKVTALSQTEFLLHNRYPGSRMEEQTHVFLFPPDRWHGNGVLTYHGLRIAEYSQSWYLEQDGAFSELRMELDLNITSIIARLYLLIRPGFVGREVEAHYDRIRQSLERELVPDVQCS